MSNISLTLVSGWPVPVLIVPDNHPDMKNRHGAAVYWWRFCHVKIVESAKLDVGLLAHELKHCEMIIADPEGYKELYESVGGRLDIEATCYAVQYLAYENLDDVRANYLVELFSRFIQERYDLRVTFDICRRRLLSKIEQYGGVV